MLVDDVERAREVRAMIRSGAISGLSIGYRTKASKPASAGAPSPRSTFTKSLLSPSPSHPGAQITSIKAADGAAQDTPWKMKLRITAILS